MEGISKAIGGATGGAAGGAIIGTAIMPFLPAGTPWWGYIAAFSAAVLVPAIAAALTTYVAPANKPS